MVYTRRLFPTLRARRADFVQRARGGRADAAPVVRRSVLRTVLDEVRRMQVARAALSAGQFSARIVEGTPPPRWTSSTSSCRAVSATRCDIGP